MLYAIIAEDLPGSLETRLAARAAHLERLRDLQSNGQLVLAGPHPLIDSPDPGPAGISGSLIVAGFASLDEANVWAVQDPHAAAGVYSRFTVKPFKKVFPE